MPSFPGSPTMIVSTTGCSAQRVARHYDELDVFYRDAWGEHVHHGLWQTGRESPEVAAEQLVAYLADAVGLQRGEAVVDVGAGYGATGRYLARRYDARVIGLTLSAAQHARAAGDGHMAAPGAPQLLHRDWMANGLPAGSADVALAIESTEHMADKAGAFAEMRRVVRPGGRVGICAWIARDGARSWEIRHLLEPICREGRLAGLGTEGEYVALLRQGGLTVTRVEDLSAAVRRTWPICLARVARGLARDARYRRYLVRARNEERVFLRTIPRLWAAYATGAMRYLLFVARRAPGPNDAGDRHDATGVPAC